MSMMSFRGVEPKVHASAFVASTAIVIGDVEIGEASSLWYGTVVRGDVDSIRVGSRSNLQDLVVVHVTGGRWPAVIGDGVTVGHRAVVHGCTIADDCLIGIGAIVLDGAEIGAESIVAAGSLVPPGVKIPGGHLVRGIPARVVRRLGPEDIASIRSSAESYVALGRELL